MSQNDYNETIEHYEKEKDNNFLYIRVFYFIRRLFFT